MVSDNRRLVELAYPRGTVFRLEDLQKEALLFANLAEKSYPLTPGFTEVIERRTLKIIEEFEGKTVDTTTIKALGLKLQLLWRIIEKEAKRLHQERLKFFVVQHNN